MLQIATKALAVIIIISGLFVMLSSRSKPSHEKEKSETTLTRNDHAPADAPYFDTAHFNIRLHPQGSYYDILKEIAALRSAVKSNISTADSANQVLLLQAAGKSLEEKIVNALIPFWYGTEWDFYGTTDTPGTGKIACGYFVSTVLKHCGFNLNRYTLAQQSAWNEARTLQMSDKVPFINGDHENFATEFKKRYQEGLYMVGLDFHVGFLLLRKGELFFIHSSYIDPVATVIEKIDSSPAFQASRKYCIAEISTNTALLKKWAMEEKIVVRKDN
jgi:hypothetical protein